MNTEMQMIYSEVYSILGMLGEEYTNKLPKSLYNLIKDSKSENYNPIYSYEDLKTNKVQKKSLAIIALLHFNYWCESEEEKAELKKIFSENEEKYQSELREKYNPDNIFNNRNNVDQTIQDKEIISEVPDTVIAKYKESFFKKILNKIKGIFKIN